MKNVLLAIAIIIGLGSVAEAAQYVIRYNNGKWDVVVVPDYAPVYPSPYLYPTPDYYCPTPYYYPTPRPCPHHHKPKPKPRHRKSCDRYWPSEHM